MLTSLRTVGIEVIECHVPLWKGIEDRVQVAGGQWASLSFVKRVFSTYLQLLRKYIALERDYDVMILGYPGQLDVFLARLLTWIHRKPLVMDLFMSIYLIAVERNLTAESQLSVKLLRLLEALSCRLPNLLICDTEAYVNWHCQTHHLTSQKFQLVPTGADDRLFQPLPAAKPATNGKFRVLYYGTYIPNHGVETIIEAANLLKICPDILFELVGGGPTKSWAVNLATQYSLDNVKFTNWIERTDLPKKIAQADLLLGVFGTTPQSLMTIQNKIYEGLAMGKAIITGTSPVVVDTLTHGVYAYLIERADPKKLAEGILDLYHHPELRQTLASQGQALFEERFTIMKLGLQYKKHLTDLLETR